VIRLDKLGIGNVASRANRNGKRINRLYHHGKCDDAEESK
jgi:hypothetical protein